MMDEDWLKDAIKEKAERQFTTRWEHVNSMDEGVTQAYQQLKNTDQWKVFKNAMIEDYKKQITNNILDQLQGLKGMIESQGDK